MIKRLINYQRKRIVDIWSEESTGFGDTIYKITETLYIPHCPWCKKRRKKWNEKLKYRKKSLSYHIISVKNKDHWENILTNYDIAYNFLTAKKNENNFPFKDQEKIKSVLKNKYLPKKVFIKNNLIFKWK